MIVLNDERLIDLPIYKTKEQYEKIESIAKQTGLSTTEITRQIIERYLRNEWETVAQMLMDKYFQNEYPKLILELEKSQTAR